MGESSFALPDGWKLIHLGGLEKQNLLWMRNGFPCGSNNLEQVGIPQLRPMNVSESGQIDLSSVKFIEVDRDVSGYLVRYQDVIFNNTNSRELVGKTALWDKSADEYVLSNHMTILRFAERSGVDPYFFSRYFHFLWLKKYFEKIRRQHVNQASISLERLREVEVPLPSLPEQRAIAHTLRAVQQAKDARQRELALERERKAALMEHLFTHGTRGEARKQTEIGMMPESWELAKLRALCVFRTGKLNSEAAVEDGKYPFFTCSQETYRIDSYSFDQEAILLAGNNAQGIYSVKHYQGKFDAYQRTYVITIRTPILLDYGFLLYDLTLKLDWLRRQSLGALTRFLTASIINDIDLTLPSIDEQRQIAGLILACDARIAALEREAQVLDELFRAMLDELMTGRLRTIQLAKQTTLE